MAKMTLGELGAMVMAEKQDSLAAMNAADLSYERARAMEYYLGQMEADMPHQEGRSRAVSTDVADTIEGMMPQLMDIFAGSDEVVKFEPDGPDDEEAAQQETDYVNHVFMQQNPGFMTLYAFLKDACLSKVGIVKVWWEEKETRQRETYYDLTEDQYQMILGWVEDSDGAIEITEHTEHGGDADEEDEPEATHADKDEPESEATS